MVINTSVSTASVQSNQPSVAKPSVKPATTGTDSVTTASGLTVNAEDLAAFDPEITSPDGAQQSTDFARNSMLNQSTLALLAHGQHQAQTVMDLLAQ